MVPLTDLRIKFSPSKVSHYTVLGHSNKMLCFWLSGFFNSDTGGRVIIIIIIIIIIIMGRCGLQSSR